MNGASERTREKAEKGGKEGRRDPTSLRPDKLLLSFFREAISVLIGNHEGFLGLPAPYRFLRGRPSQRSQSAGDGEAPRNGRYSFHCGSKSEVRDYDRRAKCDGFYS